MSEDLGRLIEELRLYRDKHYEIWKSLFQTKGGNIFTLDFLFIAAMNRSLCLLRGFCDLLASENFVTAAPLIRFQLDNCLRVAALSMVDDPDTFAREVLGGKPIRKMKDQTGKKMTDGYLCERVGENHPWIRSVYKETSGFVHLSEKHIFASLKLQSNEDHTLFLKVSDRDEFVPDSAYVEAIVAFKKLTDLLLEFVVSWSSERSALDKRIGIVGVGES